jgi:hypothetical protein
MKPIDLPTQQRAVSYCGIEVYVPDMAEFLATDNDGRLYWYSQEPTADNARYFWIATGGASCLMGIVDLEGLDWHETLQSIPKEH